MPCLLTEGEHKTSMNTNVVAPDPPAEVDNWANPTDAGLDRNTEYTFFYAERRPVNVRHMGRKHQPTKNVSPTTQLGFVPPLGILLPRLRSNIAPRHCELPVETGPRFISLGSIGQDWPPNDMVTFRLVLHATKSAVSNGRWKAKKYS